jgi:hypothetical protein
MQATLVLINGPIDQRQLNPPGVLSHQVCLLKFCRFALRVESFFPALGAGGQSSATRCEPVEKHGEVINQFESLDPVALLKNIRDTEGDRIASRMATVSRRRTRALTHRVSPGCLLKLLSPIKSSLPLDLASSSLKWRSSLSPAYFFFHIESGVTDPVLATTLAHLRAGFRLAQRPQNLFLV